MSTPNPLNSQGSLLEQKAKRKTNLPVIVAAFVGAHIVVAAGILLPGCKPEPKPVAKAPEPVLPIMTPADLGSPVAPVPGGVGAPGTLPPIGGTPLPFPAPGLAPLPTTPTAPPLAPVPVVPVVPVPEPAPAAPAGEAKVHVVVKGDSFSTMVKKYGVGVKAIEAANPGVDSTKLKLGQKINIPAAAPKPVKTNGTKGDAAAATDAGGTYTVKSGDNLGSIAKLHGTTVAKLREANGLKTDQIKVGQKLKVPAGGVKKSNEPSAGAVPAPKGDAVLAPPLPLPPSGEPAPAPAPKAPGQL